jgi:peptide/nickel transport system substrate-binding protein
VNDLSRIRALLAMLAALTAGLLVTGCGSSSSGSSAAAGGKPVRGGNLVFAMYQEPQNIDPFSSQDNESVSVWTSWWEYLLRPTPSGSGFQPQLAKSWDVSADQKTYTFHLRPGVKFSNGLPLTADDVTFSLNKAFSTSTSQLSYLNAKIASMTAPDPETVVIKFKKPWPYLLGDVSGFGATIMPKQTVESEGYQAYLHHPIGTGPFVFDHWAHGSEIVVKRNPTYWQAGKPYLNSITWRVIPSDPTRVTAVEGNQADIAEVPPRNQLATLEKQPGLQVLTFPSSRSDAIIVNVTKPPLSNQSVRQALSLAIDRNAVLQAALFGNGATSKSFIVPPPAITFQNPSLNLYPYDQTKAKQLLADAGVGNFSVDLEVTQGVDQAGIAQVVKSDLAQVGVNVNIVTKDPTTWVDDLVKQHFQLITSYWSSLVPDPTAQVLYTMDPSFCCNSFNSGWNSPQGIAAARAATSATGSRQHLQTLYDTAQKVEAEGMNTIPLYESKTNFLLRDSVHNFVSTPYGVYYLEQIWMDQ